MGLTSSRPVCAVRFCMCMCVCVCVLSGRPANTLSPGGSLIYKASNEVQQRRRARTSLRLIVCLFTFLFHSSTLPTSRGGRRTRVEIISSTCERVSTKQSKPGCSKFPPKVLSPPSDQRLETETVTLKTSGMLLLIDIFRMFYNN